MVSVAGVRGIVGETLTPEICTRLGAALAPSWKAALSWSAGTRGFQAR